MVTVSCLKTLEHCGKLLGWLMYRISVGHFGIRKCLEMAESCDLLELTVNVDGITIYKSPSLQFWPMLCKINITVMCQPSSVSYKHYGQKFVLWLL